MVAQVVVDTNSGENGVHAALVAQLGEAAVARSRLEIGDFLIHSPGGRIVVERKAWPDLVASLRDKRYSEQKLRILAERERAAEAGERLTVVYVIEGRMVPAYAAQTQGMPNHQPHAALTKMTLRDGIAVLHTADAEDTAKLVAYIFTAAQAGGFDAGAHAARVSASGYAGACKFSNKRKNADANPLQMMLCTIAGMSGAKAQAVAEAYRSVAALVKALEQSASDEALANVAVAGKRLGPALAQKIRSALCG